MDPHNDSTDCQSSRVTWLLDRLAMLLRSMPPERSADLVSKLTDGNLEPLSDAKKENCPPRKG